MFIKNVSRLPRILRAFTVAFSGVGRRPSYSNNIKLKRRAAVITAPFIAAFGMNLLKMVTTTPANNMGEERPKSFPVQFSKEELKARLTPEQYHVTQERGTERAYSGEYLDNKKTGIYKCVVCGEDLFDSKTKFNSGCGWPSFYDNLDKEKIKLIKDTSLGMIRTEVVCAKCGAHLGHVFDDGPRPTGQRYCMNSAALKFKNAEKDGEL